MPQNTKNALRYKIFLIYKLYGKFGAANYPKGIEDYTHIYIYGQDSYLVIIHNSQGYESYVSRRTKRPGVNWMQCVMSK